MNSSTVILSTAYLPPIQYFAKILAHSKVFIEVQETYSKQSYRSRCTILSCNGPLSLTIPVVKANGNNTSIKDIEIDYSTNWQKNHWKAIESAYRTSVYYDFVADLITPFYSKKEKFLLDLNRKLTFEVLKFIGIDKSLINSIDFIKEYPIDIDDFRNSIHPKQQFQQIDKNFSPSKYYQVFNDRFNFYPNLSIIDLLFNEGLNSIKVIENSIIRNLP